MSGKDSGDERDDTDRDENDASPPEGDSVAESDAEQRRDSEPPDEEPASSREDRAKTLKSVRPGALGKKARREEEARRAKQKALWLAVGFGVVGLAAGAAAGWFGHIEQGKAKIRAESAAGASSAAATTCTAWEKAICSQSGGQTVACQQAKGAASLLTSAACDVALESVPTTLAKVKAQRVPCDTLVGKLCKDLPEGSQTCNMVKERTPLFPPEKCTEMLGTYEQVLAEVRQIDQSGMPAGMSPHGSGHGADDGHGH